MRRKISQSIQAKTFLSMLALLVVCCIIIYGMVMIFLPRNYHTELEGQVTSDFYDLVEVLERNGWEASSDSLMEFSMNPSILRNIIRQPIRVGRFHLCQLPVLQNVSHDRIIDRQLLQYIRCRRIAGLCLFAVRQLQLLK